MNHLAAYASAVLAALGLVVAACGCVEKSIDRRTEKVAEQRIRYDAAKPRGKRWGFGE